MGIAAIYARKSTEQTGVADEAKSVTRQIERAREYAARKGWIVDEAHVYQDDGISGEEFERRPALGRLLNTLRPRPSFEILLVTDRDRIGREQIETSYILTQLIRAGVRVFECKATDGREITLGSATDKMVNAVLDGAAEIEREKAHERTREAMVKKAKAGHVTGGRKFGYENVEILGPNGERSHVDRRVNPIQAAVVLRIFRLADQGWGIKCIAHTLNAEAAPTPRAHQSRKAGWSASTVREVLRSGIYRGAIVWGRTAKRDAWGQRQSRATARRVPRTTGFESTGRISASSQKTSGSPCRCASASRAGRTSDRMTGASKDAPSTGSRRSTS
jgi:DNA invertase Pin-like site-specific DNA recombinase